MGRRPTISNRRGFTLFEVILALSLTVVVLLIVTTGISVQLRAFSVGRARIERAQLAGVILHRMGDDLRWALAPSRAPDDVPDTQAAQAKTATNTEANPTTDSSSKENGSTESTESTESTDSTSSGSTSESTKTTSENTSGESAEETSDEESGEDSPEDAALEPMPLVGVTGETDWLRIDVVRPMSQEVTAAAGATSTDTVPQAMRQIQTIVYYVIPPDDLATNGASDAGDVSASGQPAGQQPTSGLVRRELVRPMAVWASQHGTLDYEDESVVPIAADVKKVEFRYHDGEEWLESWDTSAKGTLPVAIEIRLFLAPATVNTATGAGVDPNGVALPAEDIEYRSVVAIRIRGDGEPTVVGTEESTFEESTDESMGESTTSDEAESDDQTSRSGGTQP